MINSKYLILILVLLILIFLYKSNTSKKLNNKFKHNKKIIGGDFKKIYDVSLKFENSAQGPISGILDEKFNYNNFKLEFTLGRKTKLVTDMKGGIFTLGSNNKNYHNLIIHLKEKELIIGLQGYNTHLSFNLNEIKNAVKIDFTLKYVYPYLNVYVIGKKENNYVIKSGYINYLGNLTNKTNNDFRLYLHPFKNAFGSFGTTSFIKNENDLSEAISILKYEESYLTNIKISHKDRILKKNFENLNINNNKLSTGKLNIDNVISLSNKIVIIKLKLLTDNLDKSGILFRLYKNNINLNLVKIDNELFLKVFEDDKEFDIISFYLKKSINDIYIEIIPYFNKHIFSIYINTDFYKKIIDFSDLNNIIFDEIIINETKNNYIKNINNLYNLVKEFSIFEEELVINNEICVKQNNIKSKIEEDNICKISDIKILEAPNIVTRKNCSTIEFKYNKNVKLEYLKILNKNFVNYKLYVFNPFKKTKKYKLINNLQINKHNVNQFTNVYLNIDDNTIGYKYKLELYSDIYILKPLKIFNSKTLNWVDNLSNINKNGTDIMWFFQIIKNIENEDNIKFLSYIYDYDNYKKTNKTNEILFKNNESIGKVEEYIITYLDDNRFTIKIKNNTDEYYIYFDDNTDINNIRLKPLPLFEGESEDSYAFLRIDYLKMNLDTYTETSECKLNVINEEGYNPITLKSEIGNLIELYGIENPYPKLYIYNNDLSKSTKPCSYIYSNENSLIKNMEAEITYISNKQDLLESNIQVNKKNPLNYWGIEKTDSINVIMFSTNLLKFPALVSSCSYKSNNDDKILQGNPAVVYYTDDIERDRNSVYEYYGPSSRPLDALNPSEYIMKLKYNETDKCYNLEFTKSVNILNGTFGSLKSTSEKFSTKEQAREGCKNIGHTLANKKDYENTSICESGWFEEGKFWHMTYKASGCGNIGWNAGFGIPPARCVNINKCNINGDNITSEYELNDFSKDKKIKLGQFDNLKNTKIYLEKVNGIYNYEFYIYTIIDDVRHYLDDSYTFGNYTTVKESSENPDYSKFTSWHIVPDVLVREEYKKIKNSKNTKNKINSIQTIDSKNNIYSFDRSNVIFDKEQYDNLYLYNATQSLNNVDIFYKNSIKIGHNIISEIVYIGPAPEAGPKTINLSYEPIKIDILQETLSDGSNRYKDTFIYEINNKSVKIIRTSGTKRTKMGWGQHLRMRVYRKNIDSGDAHGDIITFDYIRVLHTEHKDDSSGKFAHFYKRDIKKFFDKFPDKNQIDIFAFLTSQDKYIKLTVFKNSNLPNSYITDSQGNETKEGKQHKLMQYHCRGVDLSGSQIKFTKNDIMFFYTKATNYNILQNEMVRLTPHIQFFIDNLNDEIKIMNVSKELELKNMYKNYNDYLPQENDILVYKYLDSSIDDLKKYIELSRTDILKYSQQFKNKSFDSIRGNIFGVNGAVWEGNNLIYNYCSNNVSFYNNKKYAYNYKNSDEQYYMVDEIKEKNYKNKKRINTRELEEQERRAKKLIEKLTSGVNIVGFQNNKNLNINKPKNIFEIFSGDNNHFVLEWKNKSNSNDFKSGLLINIKTNDYNKLNINITTDIFKEHSIVKKIDEIIYKFKSELKNNINIIQPPAKFTPDKVLFNKKLISESWNGIEEINENFDYEYYKKAERCGTLSNYDLDENITTFKYNLVHKETYINNHIENTFNKYINDLNNLSELYIKNIIPIYNNLDIHKYNWKIEFEGTYEPDITEFHLKSVSLNKYLINIKENDNNILGWSDRIIRGSGWKFKESNIVGNVNFNTKILEEYKSNVKNIIKNRFKEIYLKKTLKLINDKTDNTQKIINNRKQIFNNYMLNNRIDKIKNIGPDGEGCYIFSPNVGENGKFLKYKNNKFSYTNDVYDNSGNTLFYISKADTSESFDIKNNDEIIIKNSNKQSLYYINNSSNGIDLQWKNSDRKWKIEMDVELQLDINRNNILQETAEQKEINQVHTLIKNNSISIKVGKFIETIKAPNIYIAIKNFKKSSLVQAHINNYLSGNMWVSKDPAVHDGDSSNFEFKFYKDDPGNTTITNCWLITNNDLQFTRKKMLNFETALKNGGFYLPPQWKARRRFYLNKLENKLEGKSQMSDCMGVPISIHLTSNSNYLSSNRLNSFVWTNKNSYSSSFYIISKNDDSNFIQNYNKSINQEQEIFNFLYNIDSNEPFIIYSNIKNISYNPEILFINNTKTTNTYKHTDTNLVNIQNNFRNSIKSNADLQKQLWKVTNRNTQILQVNEIPPNTKFITFNLDIISYNNNLSFSNNLNQAGEPSYSQSRNDKNESVIKVHYIIEHPVYSDCYIFQNISSKRFLSIYNKKCKVVQNTDTWYLGGSNQQCVGDIGDNLGIFWNNEINEADVYENDSIPERLEQILDMEKNKNTFVFKVISNQVVDFNNMWHENLNNAINEENIRQQEREIQNQALLTSANIWRDNIKITGEIFYFISNYKNYKFNTYDKPKQYILNYNGLVEGHNIINLDFNNYKKYLFKIKNLIEDPTYKIRNIQNNKYIIFKADIVNESETSTAYEDVKIYYILEGKYINHYAIQNKEQKFLKIEDSDNQNNTIKFEGTNNITDILNNNPNNKIQNPYMFKIHIENKKSEVYVKVKSNYFNSRNISDTRNIFINDTYAGNALLTRAYITLPKNYNLGVLQYIRVRYTERTDGNNGNRIWFNFKETPIFRDCKYMAIYAYSIRTGGIYQMHVWKHGYDVPYGNGTQNQLFTDEYSGHLLDLPSSETDSLGFGYDCDWKHYFKQDDILYFHPYYARETYQIFKDKIKEEYSSELEEQHKRKRKIDNHLRHHIGRNSGYLWKWIDSISYKSRNQLAFDLTGNEQYNK